MTRESILKKYFINIELKQETIDLYYVRNSILSAIKSNLNRFNGTLLDVGCGIMPYKELILENGTVSSYIGLDFEQSVYPEYSLGKPDLFWKGEEIPLDDNTIDTILATEFFEHCAVPDDIMKEMFRVLKPGGVIFFTVPFLWNLHIVPHDEYRYTPFALKRHLSNAGFTDIEFEALGGTDASLAQMMGIWLQQNGIRYSYKKLLSYFFIPVMKALILRDLKNDRKSMFRNGVMVTGISGLAYKHS